MATLMDPRVIAIIQARTSSSRLPGKVLKPILGKPMLERVVERVAKCAKVQSIVIATSNDTSDDAVESISRGMNVACFRGDLHDVLSRYYHTAMCYEASTIVRITADCPLIDPQIVDATIELHFRDTNDYTSNCVPRSFPDGLDVEVIPFAILKRAFQEARLPSEREHVTLYVNQHPDLFRLGTLRAPIDHSTMRWTVDHAEDFSFVCRIYESLYPRDPDFAYDDVLRLLAENPAFSHINAVMASTEEPERPGGLARISPSLGTE